MTNWTARVRQEIARDEAAITAALVKMGWTPPGELTELEKQVMAAYVAQDRSIPDSDLDDDQPLSLTIKTTLGVIRKTRRRTGNVSE